MLHSAKPAAEAVAAGMANSASADARTASPRLTFVLDLIGFLFLVTRFDLGHFLVGPNLALHEVTKQLHRPLCPKETLSLTSWLGSQNSALVPPRRYPARPSAWRAGARAARRSLPPRRASTSGSARGGRGPSCGPRRGRRRSAACG